MQNGGNQLKLTSRQSKDTMKIMSSTCSKLELKLQLKLQVGIQAPKVGIEDFNRTPLFREIVSGRAWSFVKLNQSS